MILSTLLKDLTIHKSTKKLNLKKLPSMGIFYKDDFWVRIKKADIEDIIEYNYYFDGENAFTIIELVKNVVRNNTFYPKGYSFEHIRAIDVIYIFFEIVKITKNKKLYISEFNELSGEYDKIEVCGDNFNYFNPTKFKFNKEEMYFDCDGFKFRMPSIGVENSIFRFSEYLVRNKISKWDDYQYDFTYFLSDKDSLEFSEIENLLTIFKVDISEYDKKTIDSIISYFRPMFKYSLIYEGRVISLTHRISLDDIWDDV